MNQRPNSTHLKHAIDSGRTGDKAPGFDPAAAPLGTDEEAGGASPSREEIAQAVASETGNGHTGKPNAVEPAITPAGNPAAGWSWLVTIAIAFVVVVILAGIVLAGQAMFAS